MELQVVLSYKVDLLQNQQMLLTAGPFFQLPPSHGGEKETERGRVIFSSRRHTRKEGIIVR